MLTEAPGPISSGSTTVMGLSGQAKRHYFSHPLSYNWNSVLFSRVSNRARVSLTTSGERYTEQDPGLSFHEYGTCSFSPIN